MLNNMAKSIIDKQRGLSKEWVFPYKDTAMHRMNDSAWKKARVRPAKLRQEENLRPAHPGYASIRIHNLKHTFGRRLRAAGVTEEDRKALLGHKNRRITSHYSGAELYPVAATLPFSPAGRPPPESGLAHKLGEWCNCGISTSRHCVH